MASDPKVLFSETFTGIDPADANSAWMYANTDVAKANPIFKPTSDGEGAVLSVNPFGATVGLEAGYHAGGDHIKTLVACKTPCPVPAGGKIRFTLTAGAHTFKAGDHPFGESVTDAEDDLRLANCAFTTMDMASGTVLLFSLTNKGVYVVYERLPFGRTPENNYACFTQVKRVASRSPGDINTLSIEYDSGAGTISYSIGSEVVFRIEKIGFKSTDPQVVTLIDKGGEDTLVPSPLAFGASLGCFTLLDAADFWAPQNPKGLVRLAPAPGGYAVPATFHDEGAALGSRLWGQGAEMTLKGFKAEVL